MGCCGSQKIAMDQYMFDGIHTFSLDFQTKKLQNESAINIKIMLDQIPQYVDIRRLNLDLTKTKCDDQAIQLLIEQLPQQIEEFNLSCEGTNITKETIARLTQNIPKLPNLKYFAFEHDQLPNIEDLREALELEGYQGEGFDNTTTIFRKPF